MINIKKTHFFYRTMYAYRKETKYVWVRFLGDSRGQFSHFHHLPRHRGRHPTEDPASQARYSFQDTVPRNVVQPQVAKLFCSVQCPELDCQIRIRPLNTSCISPIQPFPIYCTT